MSSAPSQEALAPLFFAVEDGACCAIADRPNTAMTNTVKKNFVNSFNITFTFAFGFAFGFEDGN